MVVGGMHRAIVGAVATCAEGEGHGCGCGFRGCLCGGGRHAGAGALTVDADFRVVIE